MLAVDEINAAGGIDGRMIELVVRDDHGRADSAVRIANELYQSNVVAVIGHSFSGPTIAAAPVYNGGSRPVAQISPSASMPEVSQAGDYTFRVCPSDLAHGAALAHYARDRLGLTDAAVLYNNNSYGRGVRRTFAEGFTRLGGRLAATDPYLGSRPDVSPYIERLVQRRAAQFIVVAGYRDEAEEILRQTHQSSLNLPVMGGDGLEQIELSGDLAEGVYVTAAYSPGIATPANQAFVAKYRERYPTGANPNQSAVGSYDALYLLKRVITEVGTDRRAIREGLARIGTETPAFRGVTRTIAFDSNGDLADQTVFIGVVRHGQMVAAEEP